MNFFLVMYPEAEFVVCRVVAVIYVIFERRNKLMFYPQSLYHLTFLGLVFNPFKFSISHQSLRFTFINSSHPNRCDVVFPRLDNSLV